MNIKIIFTKSFGQLIADVVESIDGGYHTFKNPCVVQVSQGQLALIPLMATTTSDELALYDTEILGMYDPETTIRNHYTSQFGGIELVTG